MNGAPPSGDREDLIGRLLTGEIDLQDEVLVAAMQADPLFASEVHAIHSLGVELDAMGPPPAASTGAGRAVARVGSQPPSRPSLLRRLAWPLVAAAAVVAGVWLWNGAPLPFAPRDTQLGDSGLWPDREPVTRAQLLEKGFDWSERPEADHASKVTLVFVGGDGKAIAESKTFVRDELAEKAWRPDGEFVRMLPATFRWTLLLDRPSFKRQQWSADVVLQP